MKQDICVQLSPLSFSPVEPDKVIETTLHRDVKTPGGFKGFCTKINTVNTLILNATHRCFYASTHQHFPKMLDHQKSKPNKHNDLYISHIKRDIADVCNMVEILSDTFINPFTDSHLVCILNGLVATGEVYESLMNAKTHGKNAMTTFLKERLEERATIDFFEPSKKLGLKIFSNLRKVVKIGVTDHMVPLKIHQDLFGQMVIIMQHHNSYKLLSFCCSSAHCVLITIT